LGAQLYRKDGLLHRGLSLYFAGKGGKRDVMTGAEAAVICDDGRSFQEVRGKQV
jgi:hypothetical protein